MVMVAVSVVNDASAGGAGGESIADGGDALLVVGMEVVVAGIVVLRKAVVGWWG